MGDDLNFGMGGLKVFIGDREIGEISGITLPLIGEELPTLNVEHPHAPEQPISKPEDFACGVTLSPPRRPRWRISNGHTKSCGRMFLGEYSITPSISQERWWI